MDVPLGIEDTHQWTVDHDHEFQALMDTTFPEWRAWKAPRVRKAAKFWRFGQAYGMSPRNTERLIRDQYR